MFRQVISYRWAEGVTEDDKAAFRTAFDGLREIPELTGLRYADDARHFDGNFDVVAVMDFPDFAAARRYVADDRHQSYIRDFAIPMIGERVVVQHDWAAGDLVGVHHVTLPVSDLVRSGEWYAVLGFVPDSAATEGSDGTADVSLVHPPSATRVVLRHDPSRAVALAGFDVLALAVGTVDDLAAVLDRVEAAGVPRPITRGTPSCLVSDLVDPDGLVIRVRSLLPEAENLTLVPTYR